jgi:hypothetical protein
MRLYPVTTSRAAPYDRNPVGKVTEFVGLAIAPVGNTTRFTYTVTAGKKAFLGILTAGSTRVTAAAPVARADAIVNWLPASGGGAAILRIFNESNALAAQSYAAMAPSLTLLAGDIIQGQTADNSTGGTMDFTITCATAEFDA